MALGESHSHESFGCKNQKLRSNFLKEKKVSLPLGIQEKFGVLGSFRHGWIKELWEFLWRLVSVFVPWLFSVLPLLSDRCFSLRPYLSTGPAEQRASFFRVPKPHTGLGVGLGVHARGLEGGGEAEPLCCHFSRQALLWRCLAFLGQSQQMSRWPLLALRGWRGRLWSTGPGWTVAGMVPPWQPADWGYFWIVVASLSCWLPDGGSGGVILELAAMVATSQFGWWLPDHIGDKAPLCPGSAMWLGGSFLVY